MYDLVTEEVSLSLSALLPAQPRVVLLPRPATPPATPPAMPNLAPLRTPTHFIGTKSETNTTNNNHSVVTDKPKTNKI